MMNTEIAEVCVTIYVLKGLWHNRRTVQIVYSKREKGNVEYNNITDNASVLFLHFSAVSQSWTKISQ